VSKEASPEDGQPLIRISQEQLKQLLSLLDNKNEGPSSYANVVSKPGLSEVTSRSWIIDSGATYHISSKLFSDKHNKCTYLQYYCLVEKRLKLLERALYLLILSIICTMCYVYLHLK